MRIISGENSGTIDRETSINVKVAAYNQDITETINGESILITKQKKVLVKTDIRLLYPRILLLTSVKGDQIEVQMKTGKTIKSRIYLSFGDIFSIY